MLGFYGLLVGFQYQNQQSHLISFDNESYDKSETISLKVPIAIPYAVDQKEFRRVNGEVEHNGEFFRLVKQRLSNDTLHIICIKDKNSKRIHGALENYIKTLTDDPASSGDHGKLTVTFLKDYFIPYFSINRFTTGWSQHITITAFAECFIPSYYHSIIHPPERA